MVPLKFAAVIFLVYFTIFVNGGKRCSLSSCKELYGIGVRESKAYMLEIVTGKQIPVYCHMTSDVSECGGGGWTLVMKIDGSKPTFHYDSDFWKNRNEFNLPGGETGFDSQESNTPFTPTKHV